MHQQYDTPEKLRGFLTMCLDPGYGAKRSPEKLAEVLPEPFARKVAEFSPHLGELRHAVQALGEQAKKARAGVRRRAGRVDSRRGAAAACARDARQ